MIVAIKPSARAKNLRITVHRDSRVVVTAPLNMSRRKIDSFLRLKASWILQKVNYFKNLGEIIALPRGKKEYREHKTRAREFIHAIVTKLNQVYSFSFNRVSIKNHATRWGSCSKKKNLNFNYRVLFLPVALAEYIVAHELCHLAELNHSKKFWSLVARAIPDFKNRRKQLRNFSVS